jgi:hypothetical protein
MANWSNPLRTPAFIPRCGDDQGSARERSPGGLLEHLGEGLPHLCGGTQRHRHNGAAVRDRPLDTGEDASISSAPLVGEHLAGEDLGFIGNAVPGQCAWPAGPTCRADAMRAVTVPVLRRFSFNEGLGRDPPSGEIGMGEVEPRVENRNANTSTSEVGCWNLGGL